MKIGGFFDAARRAMEQARERAAEQARWAAEAARRAAASLSGGVKAPVDTFAAGAKAVINGATPAGLAVSGLKAAASKLKDAASEVGSISQSAGERLAGLSGQVDALVPDAARGYFGTVSLGLTSIYEEAKQTVFDVAERAKRLGEKAIEIQQRPLSVGREAIDFIGRALDQVNQAKEARIDEVRQNTVDPIISGLGKGDSAKLSGQIGGETQLIKGIPLRLEVNGTIEVKCEEKHEMGPPEKKGRYVVSVDANLLGGLYAPTATPGSPANVEGNVMVGKGGKVELVFDNPTDASKAVETIARLSSGNPVLAPPPADVAALGKAINAVEMQDIGAATLKGKVELPNLGELTGEANARVDQAMRIEHGPPPALVIKQSATLTGQGELAVNVTNPVTKGTAGVNTHTA